MGQNPRQELWHHFGNVFYAYVYFLWFKSPKSVITQCLSVVIALPWCCNA